MKTVANVRRSYRARLNRLKRATFALDVLASHDPDTINGLMVADMRAHVEDITQCFHEFNAYWNVLHDDEEPAEK